MNVGAVGGRAWVDVATHTVLALIGLVGFATAFDDLVWLRAGVGGLLVGTAVALLARRLSLGALPTAFLAAAAFSVFGSAFALPDRAVAGVVPTGESLTGLMIGAVWGWADLLTLAAPVDVPDYVAVVPYVFALLVAAVGTTIATRYLPGRPRTAWRAALLLVGPLALYVGGILLGTREPVEPGLRGVVFALVALVGLGWSGATGLTRTGSGTVRAGVLGTVALLGGAVAIATVVPVETAPSPTRFVLREQIEPPVQPLAFASPLAGFREYSKLLEDETIFVATGLEPGQRLRLATMDAYDGHVWGVAGTQNAASGPGGFALVGTLLAASESDATGAEQVLQIDVGAYDDVWIPGLGATMSFRLPATETSELDGLRYNAATGSAVLLGGLTEGDTIRMTALAPAADLDDATLAAVPVARVPLGPVSVIPDVVAAKAIEFAGDAATPIQRLRSIELTLQSTGFFSRGTATDSAPSRAGHGADRMTDLFAGAAMIGDEEQYASVFALMARSLGYPARVVMGFAPQIHDDAAVPVEITGRDVTAWVEVAFEGVGWVPFFPTPDQTDVPQDQDPKPDTHPQPQVRQPPRTTAEQDDLVAAVEIDDSDEEDADPFAVPGWLILACLSVLIPAGGVLLPALAVSRIKAGRAHRRRAASTAPDAVRGAWDELIDRCAELGLTVPRRATRRRTARELTAQVPVAGFDGAARRVDAAVFGSELVTAALVSDAWRDTETLVRDLERSVARRDRVLSRYRLGSVQAWLAAASARVDAARAATRPSE